MSNNKQKHPKAAPATKEPDVVKTYRISETVFNKANERSIKRYGVGVSAMMRKIVKQHFSIR